ncbi:MAG TPA: choice-of-anchor tandem repeat GloVer-containing protein [Rhizomicrobium sp.]|nr:choice-of-anchor tandem repeat GloVer-containing protein [Rhizomicrobium sp.]
MKAVPVTILTTETPWTKGIPTKRLIFSLCASAVGCAFALQFPATAIAKSKVPVETVLHSFGSGTDGQLPLVGLIDVKGTLYGTTLAGGTVGSGEGTVFSVNAKTGAETVLHSFGSGTDGYNPDASLIKVKGALYGTTEFGGTNGSGTVFSIDPATGAETVVYSFCSQQNCTDGDWPNAPMIHVKDMLYGTTYFGGTSGDGTLFSLDLKTGAETVLYSFCSQQNCADGENPWGGLIDVNGTLYGTTFTGGANNCSGRGCGTVFSLDPSSGAETVLYSFAGGTDGAQPEAAPLDVDGTLYGTTVAGGTYQSGLGTVYSLNLTTGAEAVLHQFGGTNDGISPNSRLIDVKGKLYSTTVGGGNSNHAGTVFSIDPTTGAEAVIYDFCSQQNCTDGEYPQGGVINKGAELYGTTQVGGSYNNYGTVFALTKF